jgi:hypothetical protein
MTTTMNMKIRITNIMTMIIIAITVGVELEYGSCGCDNGKSH